MSESPALNFIAALFELALVAPGAEALTVANGAPVAAIQNSVDNGAPVKADRKGETKSDTNTALAQLLPFNTGVDLPVPCALQVIASATGTHMDTTGVLTRQRTTHAPAEENERKNQTAVELQAPTPTVDLQAVPADVQVPPATTVQVGAPPALPATVPAAIAQASSPIAQASSQGVQRLAALPTTATATAPPPAPKRVAFVAQIADVAAKIEAQPLMRDAAKANEPVVARVAHEQAAVGAPRVFDGAHARLRADTPAQDVGLRSQPVAGQAEPTSHADEPIAAPHEAPETTTPRTAKPDNRKLVERAPETAGTRTGAVLPVRVTVAEKPNGATPLPRTPSPATEASTAAASAAGPSPEVKPHAQAREFVLEVPAKDRPVQVHLIERNGSVRVTVRTSDPDVISSLRGNLGELVRTISQKGFQIEAWTPPESYPSGIVAQTAQHFGAGANESNPDRQSGGPFWQQQDEQPHGHARERWLEELQKRLNKE